jgi:pimeloyl-ACP methyl ester carboxylesterase
MVLCAFATYCRICQYNRAMRFMSDDAELYYEVMGDGPPVVLLHPFPANHSFMLPVADMLAARYRVILPDLRGHGDSTSGTGVATMEKHAADLLRLCEAEHIQRAVFVGVSIGGYILFEFWRRYRERVAALVFCNTKASLDSDQARQDRLNSAEQVKQHGPVDFLDGTAAKLVGATTRINRPDVLAAARKIMSKSTVGGIVAVQQGMASRPDSVPTLATINVPTLVIAGEEDVVPLEELQAIHRGITGSKIVVIPKAGHYAVFEKPDEAGRAIRSFLDSLRSW